MKTHHCVYFRTEGVIISLSLYIYIYTHTHGFTPPLSQLAEPVVVNGALYAAADLVDPSKDWMLMR